MIELDFNDILDILGYLDTFQTNKNQQLLEKFEKIYNLITPSAKVVMLILKK